MDNQLTMDIQRFLAIENPTDDQIQQAALLLFRLNRNRAMYNSALSNPRGVIRWVVADLNKFLQIRLHGMTNSENVEFESCFRNAQFCARRSRY
jgi:hypothetical protein